jgi:O-antigen ligase
MRDSSFASGLLAAPRVPAERASTNDQSGHTAATPWRIRNMAESPILSSPRAILGSVFSFEALLVLYMFAGIYKGDPRFAWIPVDPTGLFFALSVLVGGWIIIWKGIPKKSCPTIFAMLAFVVWWAATLSWSPSEVYGPSKVLYLATLALWGLIAGALIIAPNPERVRRLLTLVLLLAIWVGIESLLIYIDNPGGLFVGKRQDRALGSYQHIGRAAGFGALIVFTAWLFCRRASSTSVVLIVLFGALFFVVAIAGGKGHVLATSACILLTLLLGLRVTGRKILYKRYGVSIIWLVSALIAGLSIYVAATGQTPKSLERLAGMIEGGVLQGTAAYRVRDYEHVFKFWPGAPLLGHGAGSWTILEHGVDEQDNPHNMFLEVLLEAGVVGLLIVVALLSTALHPISLGRLRNDPLRLCTFMLFVHAFIHAMVGGDVAENRIMFMLLGLLVVFRAPKDASSRAVRSGGTLPLGRPSRESMLSLSLGRPQKF